MLRGAWLAHLVAGVWAAPIHGSSFDHYQTLGRPLGHLIFSLIGFKRILFRNILKRILFRNMFKRVLRAFLGPVRASSTRSTTRFAGIPGSAPVRWGLTSCCGHKTGSERHIKSYTAIGLPVLCKHACDTTKLHIILGVRLRLKCKVLFCTGGVHNVE